MSQRFHVLRCYKCQTFQSQIVKKSNKWECKMCGDKQSLMKSFGEGTGKECRLHVQKLNIMRMQKEIESSNNHLSPNTSNIELELDPSTDMIHQTSSITSKWTKYVEKAAPTELGPTSTADDCQYVLELPRKKANKIRAKTNKSDLSFPEKKRKVVSENDITFPDAYFDEPVNDILLESNFDTEIPSTPGISFHQSCLNSQFINKMPITDQNTPNGKKLPCVNSENKPSKWSKYLEADPKPVDENLVPTSFPNFVPSHSLFDSAYKDDSNSLEDILSL